MEETNYGRGAVVVGRRGMGAENEEIVSAGDMKRGTSSPAVVSSSSSSSSSLVEVEQLVYVRKTYWQKLSLLDKKRQNRMLDVFWGPFKGFNYPVIVYAGLMYGANALVWSGVPNATTGTVYTTIYGFSTLGVACAYIGGIVGAIIGAYYCGKLGRVFTIRLARHNSGISGPEHTLYVFVASMILVPLSMLLYGLGVTYHVHWFALVFSQTLLGVSNALRGAINYALSSYSALGGEFITTLILIRNTLSFAVNYGITPWLIAIGYRNTFIIVACIRFAWNTSLFVMVRMGRPLRERSAARYLGAVEHARSKGMSH